MCRIDDGDPPTICITTNPIARACHRCTECGRVIGIRETYSRTKMLLEGGWETFKTCAHCRVADQWLRINCGGVVLTEMADELHEHAVEYRALAIPLLRVVVGMRRKWRWRDGRIMPLPKLPPPIDLSEKAA